MKLLKSKIILDKIHKKTIKSINEKDLKSSIINSSFPKNKENDEKYDNINKELLKIFTTTWTIFKKNGFYSNI